MPLSGSQNTEIAKTYSQNAVKKEPGFTKITPRPPITDGIVVAFAPASKNARVIKSKCALPLTPTSIQVQAGGQWTDGIFPVRGDEKTQFGGAQLENISFSARLEPPEFYVTTSTNYGSAAQAQYASAQGVAPPPPLAGYVLGSYSNAKANNEYAVQQRYFGGGYGSAPPPHTSEIVMQPGAIFPQGYTWHEPHDFCALLEKTCNVGEHVRLIIGDQYMVNLIISIRTFTWYYEDSDPDVINFDLTARGKRQTPKQPAHKELKGTYTTKAGDTLYSIGAQYAGGASTNAKKIFLNNVARFRKLWLYPDPNAKAPKYFVSKLSTDGSGDSCGEKMPSWKHGHQLKKIRYFNTDGITEFTYLRAGIKLNLTPPGPAITGISKGVQAALAANPVVGSGITSGTVAAGG